MRIGYAHADSLLTYPDADNLSTSSQPIRVRHLFSDGSAFEPTSQHSTCLQSWLSGRRALWKARFHREEADAPVPASSALSRPPAHAGARRRAPAHTVRPALARRNPAARASSIGGSIAGSIAGSAASRGQPLVRSVPHPISDCPARHRHAVATSESLSGRSRCCRYCSRCCCRSGCPSTPSASRSSSCRPSSPRRARRTEPGRRAGCPRLLRR